MGIGGYVLRCAVAQLDSRQGVQYRGAVKFVKVDVDATRGVSQQYGIRAMPTLLMFRGGRVVDQLVGAAAKHRDVVIDVEGHRTPATRR